MSRYKLIITLTEVKKHGLINKNVDERLLSTCVQDAQDIDLAEQLGLKFVRYLQDLATWTPLHTELKEDYILPYIAKVVDRRSISATNNRIMNSGTGKVQSSEFRNNNIEEDRQFANKTMWDEKVLARQLHEFLGDNKAHFPNYKNSNGCEGRSSDILLNKIMSI